MTTAAKAQQSLVDTEQEAQAPWTSQTRPQIYILLGREQG